MAIFIGIDPGDHTGIAVWDSVARAFRLVATLPLHRAMDTVKTWTVASEYELYRRGVPVHIVFEDARQRTWFERERSASEYRGRLMGAGAAKRDAKIWEEYLSDKQAGVYGRCTFEAHKPQKGGTKWPAEQFARVTGYEGRTSEHARDAALLVFGKK